MNNNKKKNLLILDSEKEKSALENFEYDIFAKIYNRIEESLTPEEREKKPSSESFKKLFSKIEKEGNYNYLSSNANDYYIYAAASSEKSNNCPILFSQICCDFQSKTNTELDNYEIRKIIFDKDTYLRLIPKESEPSSDTDPSNKLINFENENITKFDMPIELRIYLKNKKTELWYKIKDNNDPLSIVEFINNDLNIKILNQIFIATNTTNDSDIDKRYLDIIKKAERGFWDVFLSELDKQLDIENPSNLIKETILFYIEQLNKDSKFSSAKIILQDEINAITKTIKQ